MELVEVGVEVILVSPPPASPTSHLGPCNTAVHLSVLVLMDAILYHDSCTLLKFESCLQITWMIKYHCAIKNYEENCLSFTHDGEVTPNSRTTFDFI